MTKTRGSWNVRNARIGIAALAAVAAALSIAAGAGAEEKEYKYIGAKACGKCHDEELIGNQLAEWKKSPHAKAMETLKSDEALKIAKEKGLTVPPSEADECVRCHSTAHGLDKSDFHRKPLAISDGVQCESCHGPGSEYRKKKTMSDHEKAVAAGMWEPGENQEICTACHNDESPTFESFDFAKYKEKIAHPIPEDVKGRYIEIEKERRKQRRESMGQ